MKYCLHYNRDNQYMADADEIIIKYKDEPPAAYKDFLNLYPQKTIIIDLHEAKFTDYTYLLLKELKNEFSNFKVLINKDDFYFKIHEFLVENNIPFFFSIKVYDIDVFSELLNINGLSDIYITNSLCFNIKNISEFCKANNINLRVCPNMAQSCANNIHPLLSFFIRPEDLKYYESYVDVIEFWSKDSKDEEVYYKVYAIDKKWFGPLAEIIHGFNEDIDNTRILPEFGSKRSNCGKRCMMKGDCHFCYRTIVSTAQYLEKTNRYIYIPKELENYESKFKYHFKQNETNSNE